MHISVVLENSEVDLVAALLREEQWAQRLVYEQYYGAMMGICLRYSGNKDEALDMLHEAFIKVFRRIDRYRVGTSLSSWIKTIVVHTCIDHYRRMVRRRTEDLATANQTFDYDPDALSQLSAQEILEAVQQLTPVYRAVFNLYVVEGYTHKEIGEALQITESTSRSNLVKARAKLQAYFTDREVGLGLAD